MTEAVRIVTHVTRQVQVSPGGVCDLGYHVMWCPKCRRPVLAGRVMDRCEELIGARASGHGRPIVALEIMPDHVHPFVKAHRSGSPSQIASQFRGRTSRRLRAESPHLCFRLSARWSRLYSAATAGAVPTEAVRRHADMQDERRWWRERPR